jgi:hypothetical protein
MSRTRGWRRSRLVAALASLPVVRALPVTALEALSRFLRSLQRAAVELALRARSAAVTATRLRAWGSPLTLFALGWPRAAGVSTLPASAPAPRAVEGEPVAMAVYASRQGNFFFRELADLLAEGMQRSGRFEVTRCDEQAAPHDGAGEHLVVAPHEFFGLGAGRRLRGPAFRDFRRACTIYQAEQMGCKHYALSLPFLAEAKRVLDLDPRSARFLSTLGLDARFFPVGYVPGHAPFGGDGESGQDELCERPIDLLFQGVLSERRSRFFARHAPFFASRRCELVLPSPLQPVAPGSDTAITTRQVAACRQAKIVLNVHRDERCFFEWHRIVVRGIWHGCLVVSEPCDPVPGLEAGEHYLQAPLDRIPELLGSLLDSEAGREEAERVRAAGQRALRERFDAAEWARRLF